MKIPVFVSCPTDLNDVQNQQRAIITELLNEIQLEERTLGKEDYPTGLPLREILMLSRHCSGGIVLGFSQFETETGTWKKSIKGKEKTQKKLIQFPSPWNQLEAGILFGLQLPLLIFHEKHISGGVFDPGVTDVYVHEMPNKDLKQNKKKYEGLKQVFLKWSAKVRLRYYGE